MAEIKKFPDRNRLTENTAKLFIMLARAAIQERGQFAVALSGGSTPESLYRLLASAQLDWSKIYIFWGDERAVPPDHADSNYRMADEALLQHISIPAENIYRIRAELPPTEAAELYEADLRQFFGDKPQFDLVLLGMGDDGHTASLFPNTAVLHETEKWVIATFVKKLKTWRITLTVPVINAARQIYFLVSGDDKSETLHKVINGDYQPEIFPSQLIKGNVTWLIDEEAGSEL